MNADIVGFGAFRFSPSERRLEKDGQALVIGGRALDILAALIERAGEVVTHRELMKRVWRDLIVDGGNLRVNIAQLRRVLGDAAACIQNVPRQGYRFVAPTFRPGARLPTGEFETEMRVVLDCNYGLLPEGERLALRRLSVFVGTFTLDAAQFVACGEGVTTEHISAAMDRLMAKSLLCSATAVDGSTRYRMLDLVRTYARARLDETDEAERLARRHAEYYARPQELMNAEPATNCRDPSDRAAVDQLHNARAALQWCLRRDESREALTA